MFRFILLMQWVSSWCFSVEEDLYLFYLSPQAYSHCLSYFKSKKVIIHAHMIHACIWMNVCIDSMYEYISFISRLRHTVFTSLIRGLKSYKIWTFIYITTYMFICINIYVFYICIHVYIFFISRLRHTVITSLTEDLKCNV